MKLLPALVAGANAGAAWKADSFFRRCISK
jgi:hypothetical protein